MILYIADFIEPHRNFKEAELVRQLTNKSLLEIYATCLVYSSKFLIKQGHIVTNKTKQALNKYQKYAILTENI